MFIYFLYLKFLVWQKWNDFWNENNFDFKISSTNNETVYSKTPIHQQLHII